MLLYTPYVSDRYTFRSLTKTISQSVNLLRKLTAALVCGALSSLVKSETDYRVLAYSRCWSSQSVKVAHYVPNIVSYQIIAFRYVNLQIRTAKIDAIRQQFTQRYRAYQRPRKCKIVFTATRITQQCVNKSITESGKSFNAMVMAMRRDRSTV